MKSEELIEDIKAKREEFLQAKIKRYPASNFRASDVHECDYYLTSSILQWEKKTLYEPGLQAIFDRGNLEESVVIKDITELGFTFILQQQPFEFKNREGDVYCRGHIDGKILYKEEAIPCEIKSMNMNTFNRLKSLEDFEKSPLHRKYLRQMQLYLYGNNIEEGIFILSNLQGHYKFIVVKIDYVEVERIIARLEKLWIKVKAKEDGEPINFDDKICSYCPFKHLCPGIKNPKGLELIEDSELEEKLELRKELKQFANNYDLIDKELKGYFKKKDSDVSVGNWLIKIKEYERTNYDIPDEVKEQFADKKSYKRINIIEI